MSALFLPVSASQKKRTWLARAHVLETGGTGLLNFRHQGREIETTKLAGLLDVVQRSENCCKSYEKHYEIHVLTPDVCQLVKKFSSPQKDSYWKNSQSTSL
jgi:hypothetical protein